MLILDIHRRPLEWPGNQTKLSLLRPEVGGLPLDLRRERLEADIYRVRRSGGEQAEFECGDLIGIKQIQVIIL